MSLAELSDYYYSYDITTSGRTKREAPYVFLVLSYPSRLCDSVNIINDRLLEGNEDFIINLSATTIQLGNPSVHLPLPSTVIIKDSDSKFSIKL